MKTKATAVALARTLPLAIAACLLVALPAHARRPDKPVLLQVTRITTGNVYSPKLRSERGNSVVFVADADVEGPGTAPGHREVYLYDLDSRSISRITNTSDGESYDASRESDTHHSPRPPVVAFVSTGDLDPSVGNADHNPELFVWVHETGQFIQITDTQAPAYVAEPYASDSAKCITFRSTADLDDNVGLDTTNPGTGFRNLDGSDEIFNLEFADDAFTSRVTTQISNGPPGSTSEHPSVGGFWFTRQCRSSAYQSDYDQLANGSTGTHIYAYTRTSGRIEQVSPPGAGTNTDPAMSSASNFARGPYVVWESSMDPIGNEGGSSEIFRFRLFKPELIQYTLSPLASYSSTISDGGGLIAFVSHGELIDPNKRVRGGTPPFNADGNGEIFRTHNVRHAHQLTRSQGCENTEPSMRDTGRGVAFLSTCDLVPGNNPDGIQQIFLYLDVEVDDPLYTTEGCKVSEGCCNEANGCYVRTSGKKIRPQKSKIRPSYASEAGP